jgi:predicted site-specific integrase-resolvase
MAIVAWRKRTGVETGMSGEAAEYLTVGEARDILGVSKMTMSRLIREGVLATEVDPLNLRVKLIKRSDVEALQARSHGTKKALARVA